MAFRYYCQNCEQKFEAPDSMRGATIECPSCKVEVTLTRSKHGNPDSTAIGIQTVNCPLCGVSGVLLPEHCRGEADCRSCKTVIPLKPKAETLEPLIPNLLPDLNGYEIVRKLGTGGMGTVFEAKQLSLNDRLVAIKILTQDIARAENLDAEVKALVKLSHPDIVTIFDLVKFNGGKALVMESIAGPHGDPLSLRDIMLCNSRINAMATVDACLKLAKALSYAHFRGTLHLDIKPENILVDHLGNLRIVDFGLAQFYDVSDNEIIPIKNTAAGNVYGTPGYMAPERKMAGTKPDARQDIYSLGAVFYEMLMGNLPEGHFKLPTESDQSLPKVLDEIIEKSLNFHPARRYQDMGQFIDALENASRIVKAGSINKKLSLKKELNIPPSPPPEAKEKVNVAEKPKNKILGAEPKDKMFACFAVAMGALFLMIIVSIVLAMILSGNDGKTEERSIVVESKERVPTAKPERPPIIENHSESSLPEPDLSAADLLVAAKSGNADAQCKLGALLMEEQKYQDAYKWFEKADAQGNLQAAFHKAEFLALGIAGIRQKMRALKLYMKAANGGNADAQNRIGEFYFYGNSIAPFKDASEAAKWFEKAAGQGHAKAMFNLGECYRYGQGVHVNFKKAAELYSVSENKGYAPARDAINKINKKNK